MPRFIGTRCGVKVTSTGRPAASRQALLDLRRVAVAGDAVGVQALAHLGCAARLSLAARPAPVTPDLASMMIGSSVDQAGLEQRPQRQLRGGRVAAGVGDQIGRPDRLARELGQAVDGILLALGRPVRLAVGPLVERGVAQAEIGREVDHLGAARQLADHVLGRAVRQAAEHDIERARIVVLDLGERRQVAPARCGNTAAIGWPA